MIGAGVVGLAIARKLALSGRDVVVIERNARIGEETSSRNSEVIHAGIHYAEGSLKAALCVIGKRQLYAYCAAKGIAHARCGKLIVAVDADQEPRLEAIAQRALRIGVDDLQWQSRAEIGHREPEIVATAGLWSPSTGIVDSHGLMLALQGDLEHAGGAVALHSALTSGHGRPEGIALNIVDPAGEKTTLVARTVVNAAGLHAARVAAAIEVEPGPALPRVRYARGSYFMYDGPSPFTHLVYPLPQDGGLGVHATLDLAGRVRFGPDVEWIDDVDYALDPERAADFYAAVRSYWPGLADGRLKPGYTGIRPKLHGPSEAPADFYIGSPIDVGGGRLLHLLGIESPGLTSALAIADYVSERLGA